MDKTNVMHTNALDEAGFLQVGAEKTKILSRTDCERYLGRKVCLANFHKVELRNRIAAGWGAFMRHKTELCGKHYSFKDKA